MHELIAWLREHEPDHLDQAVQALRCFEPFGEDGAEYAFASRFAPTTCEQDVVELLHRLCAERGKELVGTDRDDRFSAEQNAAVAADAERYYRAMVGGSAESWNVRDVHMADTLDRLVAHAGGPAVVWEHNTHVGDARATDMTTAGMVNVGQLVRERHDDNGVVLVGFGGHRGSVIAADEWGGTIRRMPVPAAPQGTHEQLLHDAWGAPGLFVFPTRREGEWLRGRRGHRAIGVVYRPRNDQYGNWVP